MVAETAAEKNKCLELTINRLKKKNRNKNHCSKEDAAKNK
jgi:hypothetical protein